jgi:hypothetical protein
MKLQAMIESIDSITIFFISSIYFVLRISLKNSSTWSVSSPWEGEGLRWGVGSKESQNDQDAARDNNESDDCIWWKAQVNKIHEIVTLKSSLRLLQKHDFLPSEGHWRLQFVNCYVSPYHNIKT